ncbi:Iron-sulfur cluster assembly iron binding protein IscA [hydrothermal vent metagenome]|uniref:Iron-sulfur cluster assembly iron binding protein IscA n=2 Tax=hydrothermal vent metagenome TaxID=652676 RepID=A0A3B0V0W8_9ZZZZ
MDTMSLHVTQKAADRIKGFLDKDKSAIGFKINIQKTGCSGWGYAVDMPHILNEDDVVYQDKGVNLIASKETLKLIAGTTIDFEKQGINHIFVYKNPNATGECGCGESFTTTQVPI